MKKLLYLVLGVLLTLAGVVGVLLPVIPQVPFLAAGMILLMLGSRRFSGWVKGTKLYKQHAEPLIKKSEGLSRLLEG